MRMKLAISPDDFPGDEKVAKKVIDQMTLAYEENALLAMHRFTRGSVLIQRAKILTEETINSLLRLGRK